jgi:lipoic acid synthetase
MVEMKMLAEKKPSLGLCIRDCGLADYREVLTQQQELQERRQVGQIPDTVLIVEHPPVITLGARKSANKLLVRPEELARRNIDLVEIRRGGGATAHNPGQLVFYPILHLQELRLDINQYVRTLEAIGIELLRGLGVESTRRKGFPGLWVGERKIASIGVRVSRFVTCHGMAINIQNDLSIFHLLVPCGLDGVQMTSVQKETGQAHDMEQIKTQLGEMLVRYVGRASSHDTVAWASRLCVQDHGQDARATSGERGRSPYEEGAMSPPAGKLPLWLRRPWPAGHSFQHTHDTLASLGLETICTNANCPNRGECWGRGTATVLILGNVCTRNCGFCSVATGRPQPPDPTEPARLADMARRMDIKYLVITSVNRDDLPDGGAGHFRDCLHEVRRQCPALRFEILTPDFKDCQEQALDSLRDVLPFVFAHNVETVPSLYPLARAGGNYERSLRLLRMAKDRYAGVQTKSSLMLGLGETDEQVEQVLRDLHQAGCNRITIGQYLRPSKDSLDVVAYIPPEKFAWWKERAREIGFAWVLSAPFARSSYFAEQEDAR